MEGAAIVVSILLAFGIDAWWDGRAARAEERTILIGLREDFAAHALELEDLRDYYEDQLSWGNTLLERVGPDAGPADTTGVRELFGALSGYRRAELRSSGTLEALNDSRGLAVITNPALRGELARWLKTLEAVDEINAFVVEAARSFREYGNTRFPLRSMGALPGVNGESRFDFDLSPLLRDVEFENHVVTTLAGPALFVDRLDQSEESVAVVLELLEQELEGRIP